MDQQHTAKRNIALHTTRRADGTPQTQISRNAKANYAPGHVQERRTKSTGTNIWFTNITKGSSKHPSRQHRHHRAGGQSNHWEDKSSKTNQHFHNGNNRIRSKSWTTKTIAAITNKMHWTIVARNKTRTSQPPNDRRNQNPHEYTK